MIPIEHLVGAARLVLRLDQTRVLVRVDCDPEGRPGIWLGHEDSDGTDALEVQVIVVPTLPGFRFLIRQPPISQPRA